MRHPHAQRPPSATLVDLLTEEQLRRVVSIAECGLGARTDDVAGLVTAHVSQLVSSDYCGIWRAQDDDSSRLHLVACESAATIGRFAFQEVTPGSQAQYALFSETEVHVADLATETRFKPARAVSGLGLVSGVMVPIIGARRFHGFLDVYWRHRRDTTDSERAFLALTVQILAGVLDRTVANESVSREAAQAQLLIEIGKVVSSSLQIESVYSKFAELVGCLIPFDRISLALFDDATGTSRTAHNSGLDLGLVDPREEHPAEGTVSGEVARRRHPVVIDSRNVYEFAARLPRFRRYVEAGLVSTLSVPITWRDRVIAVLTMRSLQSDFYGDHHVSIAERVATLIAGAVANAEMHRTLDQRASERLLLTEISRGVNSAPNERAAFMRLANGLGQYMRVDRVTLGVLDDDETAIRRRFVSGISVPGWSEGTVVSVADSGTKVALERGHPAVFRPGEDSAPTASRQSVAAAFLKVGIRSVMHIPLIYGGHAQGVMSVGSEKPDSYGERELSFADRISSLVSGFIAASNATDHIKRLQHQLDLAEAISGDRIKGERAVDFVRRIEEKISATAGCDLFVYAERAESGDQLVAKHSGGMSSRIVLNGEIVARVSDHGDINPTEALGRELDSSGIRSSAWTPIRDDQGVVGAIGIFTSGDRSLDSTKKRSMSLLARRLGRLPRGISRTGTSAGEAPVGIENVHGWSARESESLTDGGVSRLVIVDEHPACRGTIRVQLARGPFRVVGECRSIYDVQGAADGECDAVVWGIHSTDTPAVIRGARPISHLFKVMVLTDRLSIDGLREVLRAGAVGYLPRQTSPAALEHDISTLLAGGTTIDPSLLSVFISKLPASQFGLTDLEEGLLAALSERDKELLRDVGRGKTNVAIARDMNLAVGSVKNRLVEIYRRIGATDRVEAAAFAMRAGLLK